MRVNKFRLSKSGALTGPHKTGSYVRNVDYMALERENKALREALQYAGKRCEEVHHPAKYQHGLGEVCPVEILIENAIERSAK